MGDEREAELEAWRERLDSLRVELSNHPGAIARGEWDGLRASLAVFTGNARELHGHLLQATTSVDLAFELVQNVRPDDIRQWFRQELLRRLHNFVAAARTLVDHTRRLTNQYGGSAFAKEYEQQKDAIIGAPVVAFVNDLRNFILHRRLPFVGHRLTLSGPAADEEKVESSVHLNVAALLEWDGWSAASRQFLVACENGEVDLLKVIVDYEGSVGGLYEWLFAQFESLHRADIDGANRLVTEYNTTLTGRDGPWGPAGQQPIIGLPEP